jgi:hypothetical protein
LRATSVVSDWVATAEAANVRLIEPCQQLRNRFALDKRFYAELILEET